MLLRPFDIYLKWVLVNTILGNTVSTIKNFSTIKTLIRAFSQFLQCLCKDLGIYNTRSLGALRTPTSRLRPFGPALGPSGLLDNVLHALRALRPCDPCISAMMG